MKIFKETIQTKEHTYYTDDIPDDIQKKFVYSSYFVGTELKDNTQEIDSSTHESLVEYKNIITLFEIFKGNKELLVYSNVNKILYWLYIPIPDLKPFRANIKIFEYKNKRAVLSNRYFIPMILSKKCDAIDKNYLYNKIIEFKDDPIKKVILKYQNDILKSFKILHNKQYVHGDFKVANSVYCHVDTLCKLIDFGALKKVSGLTKISQWPMSTYILPFYSKYLINDIRHYDNIANITSIETVANYLKTRYTEKSRNILDSDNSTRDNRWPFAVLSYVLFYRKTNNFNNVKNEKWYKNSNILGLLEKKNDEYSLAIILADMLIYYIRETYPNEIDNYRNILDVFIINYYKDSTLNLYDQNDSFYVALHNICKLLDPDYLHLEPIAVSSSGGRRGRGKGKGKSTKKPPAIKVKNDKKKKSSIK